MNLLAGLAKCGECGGGLVVETYRDSKNKPRVSTRCATAVVRTVRVRTLCVSRQPRWNAVLTAIEDHALTPGAVEAVVAAMQANMSATAARSLARELAAVEKKIARLTDGIAAGGDRLAWSRDAMRASTSTQGGCTSTSCSPASS